jgi:hypothetical protein
MGKGIAIKFVGFNFNVQLITVRSKSGIDLIRS